MSYDIAMCYPDNIINVISMSSGWLNYWQYLIRMILTLGGISSGWHRCWQYLIWVTYGHKYVIRMTYHAIICHSDDLAEFGISSRWVTTMLLCHPDDIHSIRKSSGWDSKFRFFTTRDGPSAHPYHSSLCQNGTENTTKPSVNCRNMIKMYIKLLWMILFCVGSVMGNVSKPI